MKKPKLLGIVLFVIGCLSTTYAQNDLSKMLDEGDNTAENAKLQLISDPQILNANELTAFILKIIEDKDIKEISKKIEFVDTFPVSDKIKKQAKSYIQQDLSYSNFKKLAYGNYLLKNCHQLSVSSSSNCWKDMYHNNPWNQNSCASWPDFECCTPSSQ